MTGRVVTVTLLARYIKDLIDRDELLSDVWVEGEVTSVHHSQAGHVYFNLKDAECQIKCALFRQAAVRQLYLPKIGDRVATHGRVSIYERVGGYQLYVDVVQPSGVGLILLEQERLRQKLEAEGLFEQSRKRSLPAAPAAIGVVTSADGSVWHDILTVLRRRYPLTHVILAPSPVQGEMAANGVIAALAALQDIPEVEVIIVARGGGGEAELASFSDERLLRAVFACRVPVVAAIGHETDWTLIDEVADVRAATPTAAAELCTPSLYEIQRGLAAIHARLSTAYGDFRMNRKSVHAGLATRLARFTPASALHEHRFNRHQLTRRLGLAKELQISLFQSQLTIFGGLLKVLKPESVLARGYSVLSLSSSGTPLTSINVANVGERVTAQVIDGSLDMRIDSKRPSSPARAAGR
ncbi:MAG: exodeoxyribonuclease VII large subunit [Chloroflexota bacterium]|nr:exodeoxyribonuclease VII large subunit [Chloroflexota bacterium]